MTSAQVNISGQGCQVVITDIDENKGQETKKEFQDQFGLKDTR